MAEIENERSNANKQIKDGQKSLMQKEQVDKAAAYSPNKIGNLCLKKAWPDLSRHMNVLREPKRNNRFI